MRHYWSDCVGILRGRWRRQEGGGRKGRGGGLNSHVHIDWRHEGYDRGLHATSTTADSSGSARMSMMTSAGRREVSPWPAFRSRLDLTGEDIICLGVLYSCFQQPRDCRIRSTRHAARRRHDDHGRGRRNLDLPLQDLGHSLDPPSCTSARRGRVLRVFEWRPGLSAAVSSRPKVCSTALSCPKPGITHSGHIIISTYMK